MTVEGDGDPELPLAGMRVLELGYGVAAPVCCRNLAHFGADVIRVESARRPDSLRQVGAGWVPFGVDWGIRRDTGALLHFTCSGKRSIGLEIDHEEGRQIFERLVTESDVLAMNLSVEAVEHLGLDADSMRALNPRLIWVNLPSFGSAEGPYRSFRTWGRNIAAMAGIAGLVGWPDRGPVGMVNNLPDYLTALWATSAVVAALLRRELTGEGCELDLSQYEVALSCIVPTVLEVALGGTGLGTLGNRSDGCAPYGVYPCLPDGQGREKWVAISVEDDAMWAALRQAPGLAALSTDSRYERADERIRLRDEIDEALEQWTAPRTAWEVASELQAAGVAAAPILDNWEALLDEHLNARNQFLLLPHARFGKELVYGQGIALGETPARPVGAAPAFGQHTREVLVDVAGVDPEAVERLVADQVAHEMPRPDLHLERPYLHWIPSVLPLGWPPASQVDPARILFDRLSQPDPGPDPLGDESEGDP